MESDGDSDGEGEGDGAQGGNSDVRLDTFNEKFMSMNIDKIVHKIRDLYKDGFFYKKTGPNGIIAHVNAVRHYPIAQINLALTTMVSDPNEYVNDKYGRLGRVINVGDYYLFQPIEITDKRISIHERSTPVPYKHTAVEYPLPGEVTEDYLGIGLNAGVGASTAVPNKKVANKVKQATAAAASAGPAAPVADSASATAAIAAAPVVVAPDAPEDDGPLSRIDVLITTLADTFETCKTVIEKPTKDQEEWYYYCGKVIDQISQTEEFQITKDQLYELVIANLLEHLLFNDSLELVNYLYKKNNYSFTSAGAGGGTAQVSSVQPLTSFERMI
jgi:hypothetical protein